MGQWVRLCGKDEVPASGQVTEVEAHGITICLANAAGKLSALANECPHRQGPLGQGWIEGQSVICPWHSWAFDLSSGEAEYPEGERVAVYPLRCEGDEVLVELTVAAEGKAG